MPDETNSAPATCPGCGCAEKSENAAGFVYFECNSRYYKPQKFWYRGCLTGWEWAAAHRPLVQRIYDTMPAGLRDLSFDWQMVSNIDPDFAQALRALAAAAKDTPHAIS